MVNPTQKQSVCNRSAPKTGHFPSTALQIPKRTSQKRDGATGHRAWILLNLLIGFLAGVIPPALAGEAEAGFVAMFNGKDLTEWDGKPGWWRVENGALTAESTPEKPCAKHNYLIWRGGQPGDFELRAEYRIIGKGANSGIQFRSRSLPDWDTSGYQADIEVGEQWTGCLFEHKRGGVSMRGQKAVIQSDGKKEITSLGDSKKMLEAVKPGDWNSYRIIALGNEIVLEINGVVMCRATDQQAGAEARAGVIALQMHPGPPMKVQFRNLRIKVFDPPKGSSKP